MQSCEIERLAPWKQNEGKLALNSDHEETLNKACPFSASKASRALPLDAATNPLRQLLDSKPTAVDGFLSYEYGLCAPKPLEELENKYILWEEWAKRLPELYRTGKYQEFFRSQPILTVEDLHDDDLLRANMILALCAHATVHFTEGKSKTKVATEQAHPASKCPFKPIQQRQVPPSVVVTRCPFKPQPGTSEAVANSGRQKEHRIPPSIFEPWKAVNHRLGRPKPTFTYYDYFTLNVVPRNGDRTKRFDDIPTRNRASIYANMKCDVQVFGDRSENVFVLMNHDMEFQSTPLISLACDAVDCMLKEDDERLVEVIHSMADVVTKVTDTFLHAEPNSYSELYCDPVSWSKTIGMIIPPILNGEMSMSGLQSSFTHLVDVLIGRYEYGGELGTLALKERPWLPKLHQEFFRRLAKCSLRSYITKSKNRALHGSFNRLVRLFIGFLEAHRLKICGFLELGIKTGRTESSGQTAKASTGWQSRAWRKVNHDCLEAITEREQLLINPRSNGFIGAFVEYITELAPGSESYRIVVDITGTGIRYQAGDRVEILPNNRPEMVTKMLDALGVSGGREVTIESVEWKNAVEQHYPHQSGQTTFPIASLLKIATVRPITKEIFNNLCNSAGIIDRRGLERHFQVGMIDDVPDLLELLFEAGGSADSIVANLFGSIPPLTPRLYSIANSPIKEGMGSKVSIVISRLWYHVGSTAKRRNSIILGGSDDKRLGVCSSFLLNDSLYRYVPLRIVEGERFHLPEGNENGDIMMIALGSGAAPMFAFIEEMLARPSVACPKVIFSWGLASPKNLFGVPLLERAIREIGLNVCISFSREAKTVTVQDGKIVVVPGRQERITTTLSRDEWACTISQLARGNGIFYLCGHPVLENTVRGVIEQALSTSQKLSLRESAELYVRMVAEKRIRSDLYYSGSTHNTGLPFYSVGDVARHNNINDFWWIYKGDVYDMTDFVNLHPGGNKILFDKAGRDATADFIIAHGKHNLRIESSMLPYRIGKLYSPHFDSLEEQSAYEACKGLLFTVCEIRNVFFLDVNMFVGGNESSGSPHSLAMRTKTHEKFESATLPMLEVAAIKCCESIDSLSMTPNTLFKKCQVPPSILRDFREDLAACPSSSNDLQLYIATELCQIEKEFLSNVVETIADFCLHVEAVESSPAKSPLDGLQQLCDSTLARIKRVLDSIGSMTISLDETKVIHSALSQYDECSSLTTLNLKGHSVPCLQLQQGDTVFRSGDVLDVIYIVLEGTVTAFDQDLELQHFSPETAFGAVLQAAVIDVKRHKLGNQVMHSTTRVTSASCKLAILHPLQLLRQVRPARLQRRRTSSFSLEQRRSARNSWKQAFKFAKIAGSFQTTLKSMTIRKSSLLPFLSTNNIDTLAQQCREVTFSSNDVITSDGDGTAKCWILIEGRVGMLVDGKQVFEYNKAGQLIMTGGELDSAPSDLSETFTVLQDLRLLEIGPDALKQLQKGPLKKQSHVHNMLESVLLQHDFFERLPAPAWNGLLGEFHQVKIQSQAVLFEEGQPGESVYIVESGCLRLVSDENGNQDLRQGQATDVGLLIHPGNHTSFCIAQETTICWTLNHSALIDGLVVGEQAAMEACD